MANLIFAMNVSLDGYVDHERMRPDPVLFHHFVEHVRGLAGLVYGRRLYEIMRYWDEDQAEWNADARAYATVWRAQRKWVASRSRPTLGPNATLIDGDVEPAIRALKARLIGEVAVGGTALAHSLGQVGLVDEYRLYVHPLVLGSGRPFFAGPIPPLRLLDSAKIGEHVIRLNYAPA